MKIKEKVMKKVLLAAVLVGSVNAAMAADYTIDPTHTYPNFTVSHLGFSTMHGRFNKTSGSMSMDRAKGTGSVEVVIDVASVDTGMEKRNKHLRSPDFFNAAEFPEMTYKSTKVTFQGDGAKVEGNLTMKGVTKPVTLDVKSINCGVHPFSKKDVCGFDATAQIKRSDFGINYGLPAIGDVINITLEMEAVKN
jgi:polyisoprenoid-binding protein YceI